MSRTLRAKKSTPFGFQVRDGGRSFAVFCCPTKQARKAKPECSCWRDATRFLLLYGRESKYYRKMLNRRHRAAVRDRLSHEDWEQIPRWRKTSGWFTY